MTREDFRNLFRNGPVLLDGATGTNLQRAGMPVGVCPEQWILEHPDIMIDLQRRYVEAGTDILLAPTFTANRIKLEEYGLGDKLVSMNTSLVELTRRAAQNGALVAGDLTMTGRQLYPLGEMMFEELVEIYREQARVIVNAGADLFIVETMMSLQECRAAVLAIREICDLPVMVSLTYNEDGRTLYGTPPEVAVVVLQSLGVDAVGMNCSTGPEAMLAPVARMAQYAQIPILAKPNAGMPELWDGVTVYKTAPKEFAAVGKKLVEAGASVIGGCCGTTPEHIRALKDAVAGMRAAKPLEQRRRIVTSERKAVEIALDGRFMVIGERINPTGKKKLQAQLREGSLDLVRTMAMEQEENGADILDINMGMNGIDERQMMLDTVYEVTSTVDCPLCIDSSHVDVIEQALRIYPGRALINSISLEKEKLEHLLPVAKKYGAMFILLPLSDAGLPEGAEEKHSIIRRIVDEAQRIGMAREDIIVDGLVATIGANPRAALECFETFAYCKKELHLPTVCGLSNISFGLPERANVNTAFLTMAIANGLTMAIANPAQEMLMNAAFASDMLQNRPESDIRYIERMNLLAEKNARMEQMRAREQADRATFQGSPDVSPNRTGIYAGGEKLGVPSNGKEPGISPNRTGTYVGGELPGETANGKEPGAWPNRTGAYAGGELPGATTNGKESGVSPNRTGLSTGGERLGVPSNGNEPGVSPNAIGAWAGGEALIDEKSPVYVAVLKGNKNTVVDEVKRLLKTGLSPEVVVSDHLIAAINEVGALFDRKKYFLPQLISSANTMKLAIEYLEPMLERESAEEKATIVMATVEGDIHDIGKNLVVLMLKNYGYRVIDMGKDVPAASIVETAVREQAKIIGLSALMTTTMMRMKDVVELVKEKGAACKVIIGGAAITESFAEEIGADGYSKDAAECVKLVERLLAGGVPA